MLLAIDTATSRASIAVHDGHTLLGEYTWEAANRHTVTLLPRITELLSETKAAVKDLTAIGVCVGPGSYTGVRIGVAVAKGLALAHAIPLLGFQTLDVLVSAQPPDPRPLYAIFAAGRRRIGFSMYRWHRDSWQVESEVALAFWAEFCQQITESALVVGEIDEKGFAQLAKLGDMIEMPSPARHLRRAGFLADMAWERLRTGEKVALSDINPLYVR